MDPYPSRVGGGGKILPRKDPVLHGPVSNAAGPLSCAQLERLDRSGFLALPSLLGPELLAELCGEAERLHGDQRDDPAWVREPESGALRSVFAVHRTSEVCSRLARSPALLGAAMQVLGGPVYVHQSRINYKPGLVGQDFYWHSDFETWHVEDGMPRMRALSISVSLLENTRHNGPLMLVPGSHRQYVACAGRTPPRNYERSLRRQTHGVPEHEILEALVAQGGIDAPVGPAGSVVMFDCNTLHGSASNITPWARSNLFLVYNSVENVLEAPFSGHEPRPEYVAHRDFTPLSPLA